MRFARAAILLVLLTLPASCAPKTVDLRSRMLQASRTQDKDFPDGKSVQLTRFAHIGEIETPDGRFHVVHANAVLTGMLAPRGLAWMALYDEDCNFVRRYTLLDGKPLWCEGSKIFFWGFTSIGALPHDPAQLAFFGPPGEQIPSGNVADFSEGLDKAVMRREFKYGSSGGVEDDPLAGFASATDRSDQPTDPATQD